MLDKTIVKLINEQINKEFFSAYLYLDMANFYAIKGLIGYENWFVIQSQEERDHALLFKTYLLNNGHAVEFGSIADPTKKYENFKAPLVESLKHEQYITSSINAIYDAAMQVKDYRTIQFLDWFIKEQGEEEKNSEDNILKYDMYGSDAKALYLLDQELKARVYAPPTLVI
ncbi:ferritin [uncultured Sphaerochaeta sp.]|uniref:ferritin n=1 Tax=uncultured Sphaerochaeta sp. TaxID=886478 RepID=UPI002A0A8336|nr:ferritin [uncultured Sphaerochaeta sp.]